MMDFYTYGYFIGLVLGCGLLFTLLSLGLKLLCFIKYFEKLILVDHINLVFWFFGGLHTFLWILFITNVYSFETGLIYLVSSMMSSCVCYLAINYYLVGSIIVMGDNL